MYLKGVFMSKKKKQEEVTQAPATVKIVEKKRGGCGTFFLGFIFCFVFLFVAIGGTGLYLYYNVTLRQIENTIGIDLSFIDTNLHDMSLKELLNVGLNEKEKITEATLESLNQDFELVLPETIPGTQLNISQVYNETITFQGQEQQVKKIRIQDIINNLNEFVEAVLPKIYDHVTIQQVVDTLQTTILEDLNYPALNSEYYNIGTAEQPNYKKLADLTITQALEQLPEHFGSENLTVQEIVNAAGLSIFPDVVEGEEDIYASLRALKITEITTEDLTNSITGEILVNLVDLSAYDFTQTEAFYNTTLGDLGNYLLTLSLGQFITVEGVVSAEQTENFFAMPQFANIPRDTKLSELKVFVDALTLNQIFSEDDLTKLTAEQQGLTVAQYLNSYAENLTFAESTGIDCSAYSGYVSILGNTTATTYADTMAQASTYEYLGSDNVTAIAGIADLTLQEITESENAVNLMLENFGTLGDLLGGEQTGIFKIISEVQIADLLNDASTAITNALTGQTAQTTTLAELLGTNTDDAIIGRVMTVTVSDLFGGNPASAIKNKLIGTEGNYVTLADLLNIDLSTSTNKFTNIIAGLTMNDLIGDNANAEQAIQNAIDDVIDTVTLADVFSKEQAQSSSVLKELYNLTSYPNGTLPIAEIPNQIDNIRLSAIIGGNRPAIFNLISNFDSLTLSNLDTMQLKQNITIQDLITAGVITDSTDYDKTIYEPTTETSYKIRDMSLERILEIVAGLASDSTSSAEQGGGTA